MIKEMILAIILGCLLGFGVTGGYLAVKKSSPTNIATITPSPVPTSNPNVSISPTPITTTNNSGHQLSIDVPENESLTNTSALTIKGSTSPQSLVIIVTSTKSYLTNADNAGNFNFAIEIDSGPNIIQINSYDSSDNQASAQILVTYSTAKI